jgi:hypothetical protein
MDSSFVAHALALAVPRRPDQVVPAYMLPRIVRARSLCPCNVRGRTACSVGIEAGVATIARAATVTTIATASIATASIAAVVSIAPTASTATALIGHLLSSTVAE